MTTQYIVKYSNNYDNEIDACAELCKAKNNVPVLTVRTEKDKKHESNQTLLYKFITNKFPIVFDNTKLQCSITYFDPNSSKPNTSIISFDSNSSSSYSEFKKTFNEYVNTKFETRYYPNGRELYVGEVISVKNSTDSLANGKGTIYYNTPNHNIKYTGEFESGHADGEGTYYNVDGNIFIKANNISSGVPTQKGFLHINFINKKEIIEIDFNDLWEKFKLYNKTAKINFVISDAFVNNVVRYYWNKNEIPVDVFIFQDKSNKEQNVDLWYKLNVHEYKLDTLTHMNADLNKKLTDINNKCIVLFILMLFSIGYSIYQNMDYNEY
jgi:hypothetical protein